MTNEMATIGDAPPPAAGQQTSAAVGLAILATAAAASTAAQGGSLVVGYRLSFLIAAGLAALAAVIVALQLRSTSSRPETARLQPASASPPPVPPAESKLDKG
jgi:predicted MFS family arabinose efflux permease